MRFCSRVSCVGSLGLFRAPPLMTDCHVAISLVELPTYSASVMSTSGSLSIVNSLKS